MKDFPSHDPAQLIDHIQTRFHDTHRRELPHIIDLAESLERVGVAIGLAADFKTLFKSLELHLFKEEMRLFPMLEQGGNTLLWKLIDNIVEEHDAQRLDIDCLKQRLAHMAVPPGANAQWDEFDAATVKLFADLNEHMRLEEDVLFSPFEDQRQAFIQT
jgi:regulator of cell morphogenesis and NO signaling